MRTTVLTTQPAQKTHQLQPPSLSTVPHQRNMYSPTYAVCPVDYKKIDRRKYTLEAFETNEKLLAEIQQ